MIVLYLISYQYCSGESLNFTWDKKQMNHASIVYSIIFIIILPKCRTTSILILNFHIQLENWLLLLLL